MENNLKGFKVAILACDGFEEIEMLEPRKALKEKKALVHLIAPKAKSIRAWDTHNWGKKYKIDVKLEKAKPGDYDALLLPGGLINPDQLRTNKKALQFIDHFFKKNKPIAAICHAPLTLIELKRLRGRKLTSYRSIKSDLLNAGAKWINKAVVKDGNLITSRKPSDLPLFNKAVIKLFLSQMNKLNLFSSQFHSMKKVRKIIKMPFIK